MKCLNLTKKNIVDLESAQGSIVKNALGISKRSHHSSLLKALNIPKLQSLLNAETVSLARRVFQVPSVYRKVCIRFLARFITTGKAPSGSLIDRLYRLGVSPTRALLGLPVIVPTDVTSIRAGDGVSDTIRFLIKSDHYSNRDSMEYKLVSLLTKAF